MAVRKLCILFCQGSQLICQASALVFSIKVAHKLARRFYPLVGLATSFETHHTIVGLVLQFGIGADEVI